MCRIAGLYDFNESLSYDINAVITSMKDALTYGGPDDSGIYTEEKIALGHRRLSIIDLSPGGHQPMLYENFVITYNGEIYNYEEIKKELQRLNYHFKTGSDTEVILASFKQWGYEAVHKFRGMFAFAIYDRVEKKLLLCRDRVGVKPLYWYLRDGVFLFASELKALYQHPKFIKEIDQSAVSLFLQTGYIKSPQCIIKYCHKLEPGYFLEIDKSQQIKKWEYWSVEDAYYKADPGITTDEEIVGECEKILTESFNLRMVADVPVGMFLSGGVDSSLVTALLQKDRTKKLKTFTIGFEQKEIDESGFAKEVAEYIGTDHHELICSEEHFKEIIQSLPDIYDEPFGDSSGIPTYLVSRLAREQVTVSLSADGGDEIFTGYSKYLAADRYYSRLKKIPLPIRHAASYSMQYVKPKYLNSLFNTVNVDLLEGRFYKAKNALTAKSMLDFMYSGSLTITRDVLKELHDQHPEKIFDNTLKSKPGSVYGVMGVADIKSYLEGDILTKVDRATMQHALEGREPFLDHKILEFALPLADKYKIRNGETKWLLRQVLYKYVPKELIDRPKQGFGIPAKKWINEFLLDEIRQTYHDTEFLEVFNLKKEKLKDIIEGFAANKSITSPYVMWYIYTLYRWFKKWY